MTGWRRPRAKPVPGERCPAERTSKTRDPKVTVTATHRTYREGVRECGRCGRQGVRVHQSWGRRETAWYYAEHTVPGVVPEGLVHPQLPPSTIPTDWTAQP